MKDPVHLFPGIAETPSTPLRSASGIAAVASDPIHLAGIGVQSSCIPKLGFALFGECSPFAGPKVSLSPPTVIGYPFKLRLSKEQSWPSRNFSK